MKILVITQARFGSSRLPGKVLKRINNTTLLDIHLSRVLRSKKINELLVATTQEPEAQEIVNIAKDRGVRSYQGSMDDVLDRFYQAAQMARPDWVVRVTSDCPLVDPIMIDSVIEATISAGADYGTNTFDQCFPDGQDVEVFSYAALDRAWREAKLPSEREHVTPFIRKNTDLSGGSIFKGLNYNSGAAFSNVRMTVDEPRDLEMMELLVSSLGPDRTWREYAEYIVNHNLKEINSNIVRNEGYQKSLKKDEQ